jgi:hypothetical protein
LPVTIEPSQVIAVESYYTDGRRLVMVTGFYEGSVIVEDAATEREFLVVPGDFGKWRAVKQDG